MRARSKNGRPQLLLFRSHEGHMLEKSSFPPVQCLFCNHLNPAGARFCNDCGSQLHLQPCDRCGATNKRTAKTCYKCGAGFTLPGASGLAPELEPEPPVLDHQPAAPPRNEVSIAREPTPFPESVAPPVNDTVSFRHWATAIGSRRAVRIAAVAILLLAIVMSGEYYSEQSAEFTKTQGVIPFAPNMSDTAISGVATAPAVATPVAGASVPVDPPPKIVAGTSSLDKTLSLAPPGAGVARTTRPLPVTEAEVMPRQDPPVFRECPDAVAALGFCNPTSKTEGK